MPTTVNGIGTHYHGEARWQRRSVLIGSLLLLATAGLTISNEYFRRNRSIYVLNASGKPLQVQVDGALPLTVNGLGRLVVSEGHHRLKLSGPIEETHEVDVQTRYIDRWLKKPVWVLNPGNEAVVEESTLHYAMNPRPADQNLIVGQPFLFRGNVDYAFEAAPDKLEVKSKSAEVTKTSLRWEQGHDNEAFYVVLKNDRAGALGFAERRLRRDPVQGELLKSYLDAATRSELPRFREFLKKGLDRRPVVVHWHRAYQNMSEFDGNDGDLVARYDRFLAAEPANGSLLYLRGRVERDWEQQEQFYQRAAKADPHLPWPWAALGVRAVAGARWDDGLKLLHGAQELKIDPDQISTWLQSARLGVGDAKALANELKSRLSSQPFDVGVVVTLAEALAASGEPEKIEPAIAAWHRLTINTIPSEIGVQLRVLGLYDAGKLEECADRCLATPSLKSSSLRVQALLALMQSKSVTADASFGPALEDPRLALALSLGLFLDNQPEEAARWRERAIQSMESMPRDVRQAAAMLKSANPPPVEDLRRVIVEPDFKAVILALLAERFPARRAGYTAEAARFNIRRRPPFHLVRSAIERTKH